MKDDTIYFMIENWSIKYKVKDLFKNNIFQIQYASWNDIGYLGKIILMNI